MKLLLLIICILFSGILCSEVLELTPDNFDSVVVKGQPVFIDFYAPWCGFCKKLDPDFKELAAQVAAKGGRVVIAKLDASKYGDLAKRYKVNGYPTLYLFQDGPENPTPFNGDRTLNGMIHYLNQHLELRLKTVAKKEPLVFEAVRTNHAEVLEDTSKNVLLAFYDTLNPDCAKLEPVYNDLSAIYRDDITFTRIEGINYADITKKFQVTKYPTAFFFPKDRKATTRAEGVIYTGALRKEDMIRFIDTQLLNAKLNTEKRGVARSDELDVLVQKLLGGDSSAIQQAEALSAGLEGDKKGYAEIYLKYMRYYQKKAPSAEDFPAKEIARLSKLVHKGGIDQDKSDSFIKTVNILRAFNKQN